MIDIALLYKIIEIVFLIKKILISFYNKKNYNLNYLNNSHNNH